MTTTEKNIMKKNIEQAIFDKEYNFALYELTDDFRYFEKWDSLDSKFRGLYDLAVDFAPTPLVKEWLAIDYDEIKIAAKDEAATFYWACLA